MKTSRIALLAAAVCIAALMGSTHSSSAFDLSWASNKGYVQCLNNAGIVSNNYGAQRGMMYDRLRRACNRGYFPNRPGFDY
jgi:hypothetical protein